ncbi:MAG: FAD-dependent oxidoreductase [Synechococcaceae cyanobacterium SM2_3_1]|nr:FAD-dependent oxidoreductase [Synechococcaceae cyanobacterium SM2_3_1]
MSSRTRNDHLVHHQQRSDRSEGERPVVILAGCGYGAMASIQALHGLAQVIAINPYPYQVNSGMTTRLLSGRFSPEMVKIPLLPHFQEMGVHYLQGKVTQVFPDRKQLQVNTDQGFQLLNYDVLLLNVGRQVADHGVSGLEHAFKVRPMQQLVQARHQIESCWQRAAKGETTSGLLTFAVVGGGFSGVELVGELYDLCQDLSRQTGVPRTSARLILVSRREPALETSARFSQLIRESLQKLGVEILYPARANQITSSLVTVQSQNHADPLKIDCQTTLWCAGLQVPAWLAESGLPTAPDGSVRVDQCLRVQGYDSILAMGDCAHFERASGEPLPKVGVYAVREGPVAAKNLAHLVKGEPLQPFEPQKTVFISVTVGNRVAVMQKGPLIFRGYIATFLKNLFDWLYMRRVKSVNWRDFFY